LTNGSTPVAAGSVVVIEIGTNATFGVAGDQAINNPTTANVYLVSIAGSFGDVGDIGVVIINEDQIHVSGDIYTTLEFTISTNTVGFGSFTNNNVRYATLDELGAFSEQADDLPVKLTAGTNALNGLTISIRDEGDGSSAGLYSTFASELIPAAPSSAVISNSKKYGMYGKNSASLSLDPGFDNDGVTDLAVTRLAQTFAYSSAQVNGSIDLSLLAATDATARPGSYSDTLTLTCTGNY